MMLKSLMLIVWLVFIQNAFGNGHENTTFNHDIVHAAIERTQSNVHYDGRYLSIPYPNGDVPADIGVCTVVVIRTYRAIGSDIQQLVHEDMLDNFGAYPSKRICGMSSTDINIDHRGAASVER